MHFSTGDREMRQEFIDCVTALADRDGRVVFLDADLSSSSGSAAFQKAHPDRFFNCGIQEANMVGVAAGLSAGGFVPFVHSFAAFITRRVLDQVFMSCAYSGLDVRLVGSDPGVANCANGGTHMALEDIGTLRSIPRVVILDPSDPAMCRQLVEQSMASPAVYYFRLFRKTKVRIYPADNAYAIGRAHVAFDGGRDATIVSAGFVGMTEALGAAAILEKEGIRVRVLDMFTIKPLDEAAVLDAAMNTGAVVVLDNHNVIGGLGSAVAEVLAGRRAVPFRILGANGVFGEVGSLDYVVRKFGMDAESVAGAVRGALRGG